MTLTDFIVELFCHIDEAMIDVKKDKRSHLWPSEIVTIVILYALKGQSQGRFSRWLKANYKDLFPNLPKRSRLFRLLRHHKSWSVKFLDTHGMLHVSDSLGIELIFPRRQGRSSAQIGAKTISNGRWIVGVKFCPMITLKGRIFDWDVEAGHIYDGDFQRRLKEYPEKPKLVDSGFHRSKKRGGDCENLIVCQRGQRNYRMIIETVFSGMVEIFGLKKIRERSWSGIEAHLGFACGLESGDRYGNQTLWRRQCKPQHRMGTYLKSARKVKSRE